MIPFWSLCGKGSKDPGKALLMVMAEVQDYNPGLQAHFKDIVSLL